MSKQATVMTGVMTSCSLFSILKEAQMLTTRMVEILGGTVPTCSSCMQADAVIEMHGYAEETAGVFLCRNRPCSSRASSWRTYVT